MEIQPEKIMKTKYIITLTDPIRYCSNLMYFTYFFIDLNKHEYLLYAIPSLCYNNQALGGSVFRTREQYQYIKLSREILRFRGTGSIQSAECVCFLPLSIKKSKIFAKKAEGFERNYHWCILPYAYRKIPISRKWLVFQKLKNNSL